MYIIRTLTRRTTTTTTQKLVQVSRQLTYVASSRALWTPRGTAAPVLRPATRTETSSPPVVVKKVSRGSLFSFRRFSKMADRDAAADDMLRAMADPLDGLDEALANEELVPTAPWGLAVYRTAYGDDAAWHRLLARLEAAAADALALRGRDDLLARHRLTPVEDAATLDGAATRDVRARFADWAARELQRHWRPGGDAPPPPDDARARRADPDGAGYFAGTRYNYCLQVDDVCLESLEHMAHPVVRLVRKAWDGGPEDEDDEVIEPGAAVESDNEFDDEADVGWMYLPVVDYVECCNQLHDVEFWYDGYYVRPPFTFLNRRLAHAPGFWRRTGSS